MTMLSKVISIPSKAQTFQVAPRLFLSTAPPVSTDPAPTNNADQSQGEVKMDQTIGQTETTVEGMVQAPPNAV